jgi:hypothetical protein
MGKLKSVIMFLNSSIDEGSAQWRSSKQMMVDVLLARDARIYLIASWSFVFQKSGLTFSVSGYFME